MDGYDGLLLFFILVPVLFLAFITTKFVARKSGNAMKGKYISIVETISLGVDKRLHLLKVGEQFILISSCAKNIEFISNIELSENIKLEDAPNINVNTFDFKRFFEKYLNKNENHDDEGNSKYKNRSFQSKEEKKSFRKNLYKLKNITTEVNRQD